MIQTQYGRHVRRLRRLLGVKQSHLAAVMRVAQTTVSRWESGTIRMAEAQFEAALGALGASAPDADRAIRRLVEGSALQVHLVCDRTHRLLAVSPVRAREWRVPGAYLLGRSLLVYASPEILAAEDGLRDRGWYETPSGTAQIETGPNDRADVPIRPGTVLWERLWLADGSPVRVVTTLLQDAVHA